MYSFIDIIYTKMIESYIQKDGKGIIKLFLDFFLRYVIELFRGKALSGINVGGLVESPTSSNFGSLLNWFVILIHTSYEVIS